MNNLFKGAALFIGGALAGATVALLLSPKTGEEVREQIKDFADETKKRMQEYCEQLKQDLSEANAAAATPQAEEQPKAEEA
jgi:gas vesicle protein